MNLRNALLDGDRVALIDLEDAAAGPAAADLGQRARRAAARARARRAHRRASARSARALLAGYAAVAPPPRADALRWHTAAAVLARARCRPSAACAPAVLRRLAPLLRRRARRSCDDARRCSSTASTRSASATSCARTRCAPRWPSASASCWCAAARCPTGSPARGVELVALPPLGVGPDGRFVSHDPRLHASTRRGRRGASGSSPRYRRAAARRSCSSSCSRSGARSSRASSCRCSRRRAARGALTACSLRDILVSRRDDQRAHDDRARARSPTRTSTPCSCTATRASRGWRRRSRRARRSRVPVHYTGFVVARAAPAPRGARGDARGGLGRRRARRRAAAARGAGAQRTCGRGPACRCG